MKSRPRLWVIIEMLTIMNQRDSAFHLCEHLEVKHPKTIGGILDVTSDSSACY
jgi:hypothetical protein